MHTYQLPRTKLFAFCVATLSAMALTAFGQFPAPLLYYSFDDPAGASIATDATVNGLDGTVVGNVVFGATGAPGGATPTGAAQFSVGGSTGILNVTGLDVPSMLGKRDGTAEQMDLSYTMACWILPDAASLAGDRFFVGQTTQGIHNGLRDNGRLHQAHWSNDHYGGTPLNSTDWVHATFTYDGVTNTGTIYNNGVQAGDATSKDGPNGSGNLILGGRQGASNTNTGESHYVGLIDEFVIFQEVLTPAQITLLAGGASPIVVVDTDNDNLPDSYERTIVGADDLTILNGDGVADADLDTLTDLEEFEDTLTNPLLADTDGDLVDDNEELSNANGSVSDPLDPDSDDDGATDGEEILGTLNGAFGNAPTDPSDGDSDDDGSTDKYELDNGFDPNLDTSKPDILLVQPSFDPLRFPGALQYVPGAAGWDFEQNFYDPGVVAFDQAEGNYNVHTSGSPLRNSGGLSIQPYLDHGARNDISANNLEFPEGGGDNFTVRANTFVEFTQGGNYELHHGSDDTSYTVIDIGTGTPTIAQNNCCPGDVATSFSIGAPGFYPIDFVFGEQSGLEWLDLGISGPGITGTVALGDVANGSPAVFLITLVPDDSDGDNIPDAYEEMLFPGDLDQLGPGDFDLDGVNDPVEFTNGTDPIEKDTDLDGLEDGEEVTAGTDPLDPDSDNDGISDGDEVDGTGGFVTNPNLADSDVDGFDDGIELTHGSNPTDPNSLPVTSLPIVDDFEDGVLDTVDWMVNLDDIPAGANVIEQGGHLSLISRGYLVTVGEFDPEQVGGLCITGEWTFVDGSDFIQILTRTDGLADPANCCGETASGVEFYAFAGNEAVTIRARNGDHTLGNVVKTGDIVLDAGSTYNFAVIDDGLGGLTFMLEDQSNLENKTIVTADLTADLSANNHVAFHNREGGRTSQIESVTIKALAPPIPFLITAIDFDPGNGQYSITWRSEETKIYRISYGTDLQGWLGDVTDGVPGDASGFTTVPFVQDDIFGVDPNAARIFFRVVVEEEPDPG